MRQRHALHAGCVLEESTDSLAIFDGVSSTAAIRTTSVAGGYRVRAPYHAAARFWLSCRCTCARRRRDRQRRSPRRPVRRRREVLHVKLRQSQRRNVSSASVGFAAMMADEEASDRGDRRRELARSAFGGRGHAPVRARFGRGLVHVSPGSSKLAGWRCGRAVVRDDRRSVASANASSGVDDAEVARPSWTH